VDVAGITVVNVASPEYLDAVASAPPLVPHREPAGTDPLMLIFTSGTSGNPKAVPFAHIMAVLSGSSLALQHDVTPADVCYLSMPLFHSNGVAALLSSVSHDLRSPLSAISASASSLRDYGAQIPSQVRETFLTTILSECGRLDAYTANLLQLSKLESGTKLPTQVVDVNDVVVSVVNSVVDVSFRGRVHLKVPIGLLVKVNPTLFELALSNIVANAIGFSAPASTVAISAERVWDSIIIEVRDEGVGIPAAEMEQVFGKFYRASNAAGMTSGSGLGLAIARGFVHASGGSIWAEVPGIGSAGTTIGMQLPSISMADIDGQP
jgi:K+-sensing histidine kinase KdpD